MMSSEQPGRQTKVCWSHAGINRTLEGGPLKLCPESRVLGAPPIGSFLVQGSMRNWRGYDLASIHGIPLVRLWVSECDLMADWGTGGLVV